MTPRLAAAACNGGPERLRAHLAAGVPLSAESDRCSEIAGRLRSERHADSSEALEALWDGGGTAR